MLSWFQKGQRRLIAIGGGFGFLLVLGLVGLVMVLSDLAGRSLTSVANFGLGLVGLGLGGGLLAALGLAGRLWFDLVRSMRRLRERLASLAAEMEATPALASERLIVPAPPAGAGEIDQLSEAVTDLFACFQENMEAQTLEPLRQISGAVTALTKTDTANLAIALTAVAQGDLATKLQLQSEPLSVSGGEDVRCLAEAVNDPIVRFREGADGLNELTLEPLQRLCYVGPDSYQEGRTAGQAVAQVMSGAGQVGVLSINKGESGVLGLRIKGLQAFLRERFPQIQVVEIQETYNDAERTYALTRGLLKQFPQVACIYTTAAAGTDVMARAVTEAGRTGRVQIVCHDLVRDSIALLEQGMVAAIIGQDALAQGHDPAVHLFNHVAAGWRPASQRLLTKMDIVTSKNYRQFWQPGRGLIETEATAQRRAKPLQRATRPVRIAVLSPGDHEFWLGRRDFGHHGGGRRAGPRGGGLRPRPGGDCRGVARHGGGLQDQLGQVSPLFPATKLGSERRRRPFSRGCIPWHKGVYYSRSVPGIFPMARAG